MNAFNNGNGLNQNINNFNQETMQNTFQGTMQNGQVQTLPPIVTRQTNVVHRYILVNQPHICENETKVVNHYVKRHYYVPRNYCTQENTYCEQNCGSCNNGCGCNN